MAKNKSPVADIASAASSDSDSMDNKSVRSKMAATSKVAEFEKSLDELEHLVARMEQGELSLDESLKSFERGIALFRNCQGALEQAELRVKQLLDPGDPDASATAWPVATASRFDPDTP